MKNLIIIIGTIILGGIIVTTLVLGDTGSLQSAAEDLVGRGVDGIAKITWPTP